MGSTNSTPNYELSQFIGTDKPAWLQDYNGDMLKIDTGIAGAKTAADNAQSAADGAQGDATSALNSIADINTELGTVENTLSTATGNINTINSLIGNGTPTTTDQTIIGAINEINSEVGSVKAITTKITGKSVVNSFAANLAIITADGVKTYGTLLGELFTAITNAIAGLENGISVVPTNIYFSALGITVMADPETMYTNASTYYGTDFVGSSFAEHSLSHYHVFVSDSPVMSKYEVADTPSLTITDLLSTVPADGSLLVCGCDTFKDV